MGRSHLLFASALFAMLLAAAALYWPALGGGLHFDDRGNLEGLVAIVDASDMEAFIFSGTAGPLGRPVALASFAAQAYAWPGSPEVFLYSNILIHLLNGALLVWLLLRISGLLKLPEARSASVAIAATALWLLMPLQASSSLFVVQRMTTLSASFMLSGMLGYLVARQRLDDAPRRALLGMSAALGFGTLLAVLTKENGALLPVLVLVLEVTLFRGLMFRRAALQRAWAGLCLVLPLIVLLAYVAMQVPYPEGVELRRGFSAAQRLWTEAVILWQYLFHAFLPVPQRLVPFHDDLSAVGSLLEPLPLLATLGWAVALGVALRLRRRSPLPLFALCWYLGAHLLESTVLNLELYFAHRNYLALIGPVYALVLGVWSLPDASRKLGQGLLVLYLGLLAASLLQLTTLWGRPDLAAEMWAIHRPDSVRVQQHLAGTLHQNGYHRAALRVLDELYGRDPVRLAPTGAQALLLSCAMHPDADHSMRVDALAMQFRAARFELALPETLHQLRQANEREPCRGAGAEAVRRLAEAALTNPAYRNSGIVVHNLHSVLADIAIGQRDLGRAMHHIEQSMRVRATMEGLHTALNLLISAGLPEAGYDFIAIARQRAPSHPVRSRQWARQLEQYEQQLADILVARAGSASTYVCSRLFRHDGRTACQE